MDTPIEGFNILDDFDLKFDDLMNVPIKSNNSSETQSGESETIGDLLTVLNWTSEDLKNVDQGQNHDTINQDVTNPICGFSGSVGSSKCVSQDVTHGTQNISGITILCSVVIQIHPRFYLHLWKETKEQ